jgi:hypothetical protein
MRRELPWEFQTKIRQHSQKPQVIAIIDRVYRPGISILPNDLRSLLLLLKISILWKIIYLFVKL